MGLRRRLLAVIALSILLLGLTSTGASAIDHRIVTSGLTFVPPALTITVGDSLTHTNADPIPHNVQSEATGVDGTPLFSSMVIGQGESSAVEGVADLGPGSYGFFCLIHPTMRGTITVEPSPAVGGAVAVPVAAVPTPTSITVFEGNLYAASWAEGTVYEAPILSGGLLGPRAEYVTGLSDPLGIAFAPDGTLFVADSHVSTRPGRAVDGRVWAITPGGGDVATVGEIVLDDLPNGRHNTNGLAVHDGRLYVANGNSTDDGTGAPPEEELSGTLLSLPLHARGLTPADLEPEPEPPLPGEEPREPGLIVEARGMRNLYDVAFRPGTAEAWIPTNGPDTFDPYGEDLLHKQPVSIPPYDFGFPECIYRQGPNGPEYIQNSAVAATQVCDGTHQPPEQTLGLHTSADGLAFGPDDDFWDGDLFIALFGNFFGDNVVGHKIVLVPIADDGTAGRPQDLLPGGLPLDVTFGPDGMYVADFGGAILLVRPAG